MINYNLIRSLFILVFIYIFSSSLLFAQTQSEATTISGFNQSINKTFIGDDGDNWWKFDAKAGEGVTVTLTGHFNSGSVYFYLYNEDGTPSLNSTGYVYNGKIKYFSEHIAVTGTYYLKITGSAIGNYDLSVYNAWYNVGIDDADRTFYSTRTTSRYLSSGNHTRSQQPNTNQVLDDHFHFTANAGDTLNISLTANYSTGSLYLTLYDANGVSLATEGYVYSGQTKVLSEVITQNGLYYLKLEGSAIGSYSLSVTGANSNLNRDEDSLKDAAEYYHATNPVLQDTNQNSVNDDTELLSGGKPSAYSTYLDSQIGKSKPLATSVPFRDKKFNGEFISSNYNYSHWWKFDASANEGITVVLTGHFNASSVYIYLRDESGATIKSKGYAYNGDTIFLSEKVPTTGTYYIEVEGSAIGNYDLTIYNAWYNTGTKDTDRNFYANYASSRYLVNGEYSRRSQLDGGNPFSDYFRFTADAGETLNISLTGHFNTGGVYFYLYYVNGANVTQLASEGYVYDGETESITELLNIGGSFYLKVEGSAVGTYNLDVTGINPPPSVTPSKATLISPNGNILESTPEYRWMAVSNATWYYLYVNDSSGFKFKTWYQASQAGCSSGTGICSVTPSVNLGDGNGKWWIKTANSAGHGLWSDPLIFNISTNSTPVAATLTSPSGNIADSTPEYQWNAVSNATWYYLWVNDSSGNKIKKWYTALQANCSSGSGTCSITPSTTLANGTGKFWIQTWNTSGYGAWSSPMGFNISSLPIAVTLISPNGSITDSTPEYQWSAVSNATWYYLWVNDSSGNKIKKWYTASQANCSFGSGICSVTPSTTLANGAGKFWIRTWNSSGYGAWSSPMSFNLL